MTDTILFHVAIPRLFNPYIYNWIQLLGEMGASAGTIVRRNDADDRL